MSGFCVHVVGCVLYKSHQTVKPPSKLRWMLLFKHCIFLPFRSSLQLHFILFIYLFSISLSVLYLMQIKWLHYDMIIIQVGRGSLSAASTNFTVRQDLNLLNKQHDTITAYQNKKENIFILIVFGLQKSWKIIIWIWCKIPFLFQNLYLRNFFMLYNTYQHLIFYFTF